MIDTEFALGHPKTALAFAKEDLETAGDPAGWNWDWSRIGTEAPELMRALQKAFLRAGKIEWLEKKAGFDFYKDALPLMSMREANDLIQADTTEHFARSWPGAFEELNEMGFNPKNSGHVLDGSPLLCLSYGKTDDKAASAAMGEKMMAIVEAGKFMAGDEQALLSWSMFNERMPLEVFKTVWSCEALLDRLEKSLDASGGRQGRIGSILENVIGASLNDPERSAFAADVLVGRGILTRKHASNPKFPAASAIALAKKEGSRLELLPVFDSGWTLPDFSIETRSRALRSLFGSGLSLMAMDLAEARRQTLSPEKIKAFSESEKIKEISALEEEFGAARIVAGKNSIKISSFCALFVVSPDLALEHFSRKGEEEKTKIGKDAEALLKWAAGRPRAPNLQACRDGLQAWKEAWDLSALLENAVPKAKKTRKAAL